MFLGRECQQPWRTRDLWQSPLLLVGMSTSNKAVETDAQVRPRAWWRASILVRRSPLR
jgi:hypothetical protein